MLIILETLMHDSPPAAHKPAKLRTKLVTKVNQFDSSLSCQEDVVAFDITMDNPVVV